MKEFVRRRYATARAQLDKPGARPEIVRAQPRPHQGPRPGASSDDAPSELHVAACTPTSVTLAWTDNARVKQPMFCSEPLAHRRRNSVTTLASRGQRHEGHRRPSGTRPDVPLPGLRNATHAGRSAGNRRLQHCCCAGTLEVTRYVDVRPDSHVSCSRSGDIS